MLSVSRMRTTLLRFSIFESHVAYFTHDDFNLVLHYFFMPAETKFQLIPVPNIDSQK